MTLRRSLLFLLAAATAAPAASFSLSMTSPSPGNIKPLPEVVDSRRSFLSSFGAAAAAAAATAAFPDQASAAADCMKDCLKSCNLIAPKDPSYCKENCLSYCDQPDRRDGLSGSISSEGGETGILGTYTVVKGEDKPPSIKLPGLDFGNEKGKKLIGY
eukprot:CAMPEP_0183292050 /NCGR_PEP_ID=MMETSP0160_2-20130417/1264_1 /TAXON_ID=2839 ORGANISM="Odontella Sinensis, Strain Grunow 1884" /NCGR_SAMPLE_ID=MMETSP0160_2 /ASSEMBLY_ACC=CAM_ASM_000250 /LENGTH=157 /DNA_ID=CAMNT_0025452957 /DNA_START=20 /DNA_END=493 /DNA_ORIENTATION=+